MKRYWSPRNLVELHRQDTKAWYRIENKADSPAEVYIYDEIGYFGTTADDFVKDFAGIDASNIDVHLNSPGGDVFDGIAIMNCIKNHKANITMHIDALAASAASFIAMAGDEIVIAKNAEMMIHDAHGVCIGNSADMRDIAERMDKVSNNIASMYADRTGDSVEEWRTRMQAETWYSATEAVDAGLADRIAGKTPDKETKQEPAGESSETKAQVEADPFANWNPDVFRDAIKEVRL